MDRREWTSIYNELKNMYHIVVESEQDDVLETVETYQTDQSSRFYSSNYIIESSRCDRSSLRSRMN
jgi:hypothetical protein